MDANYFTTPVIFLIDTLLSLYILTVLLRFIFQCFGVDFYNPISQFIVQITHPPLKVLRKFVPPMGKIDTSSLVLALILQMLADFIILLLKGASIGIPALLLISCAQLIELSLNIFIFAIFAQSILSWFNNGQYRSIFTLLDNLTSPILTQCQKLMPNLGNIDLSPLIAIIFLQLLKMMLLPPIQELAGLIG